MKALIDGNNIFHATCHAVTKHEKTVSTNRLLESCLTRCKALAREYQDPVFVFDGLTARAMQQTIVDQYKGNRQKSPTASYASSQFSQEQVLRVFKHGRRLLPSLGFNTAVGKELEGDQIIGDLALRATDPLVIVSADKDFNQLISETVQVYHPIRKELLGIDYVVKRYGVLPKQFAWYLALVGDQIDNVPGVVGCGPAAAIKLIEKHRTLQKMLHYLEATDDYSLSRPERLVKEQLKLFKRCYRVVKLGKLKSNSYRVTKGIKNQEFFLEFCRKHDYRLFSRRF